MIGRISDFTMVSRIADNLTRLKARVGDLSEQVATGSRVNRASDDPAATGVSLRSVAVLHELGQDTRAANFGLGFLGAQDGLLDDASNIIERAREIAIQQANGLTSATDRAAAATEVHSLLEALVGIGNSDLGGRRLFSSGEALSGGDPFTNPNDSAFDPDNPYVGSTTPLQVEIGGGQKVRVTTTGSQIFDNGVKALDDLETRLRAGTDPAPSLTLMESAATDISTERTSVGSRVQRLDQRLTQIDRSTLVTRDLINSVRGFDPTGVAVDLVTLQTQLQVAAAASQRILDASLINILGI